MVPLEKVIIILITDKSIATLYQKLEYTIPFFIAKELKSIKIQNDTIAYKPQKFGSKLYPLNRKKSPPYSGNTNAYIEFTISFLDDIFLKSDTN
jgi:hypothetical protein